MSPRHCRCYEVFKNGAWILECENINYLWPLQILKISFLSYTWIDSGVCKGLHREDSSGSEKQPVPDEFGRQVHICIFRFFSTGLKYL